MQSFGLMLKVDCCGMCFYTPVWCCEGYDGRTLSPYSTQVTGSCIFCLAPLFCGGFFHSLQRVVLRIYSVDGRKKEACVPFPTTDLAASLNPPIS